jgi:hypothetical protein
MFLRSVKKSLNFTSAATLFSDRTVVKFSRLINWLEMRMRTSILQIILENPATTLRVIGNPQFELPWFTPFETNFIDRPRIIGNGTRDLTACSIVRQSSTLPRTSRTEEKHI